MSGWTEAEVRAAAARLGLSVAPHQMPGLLASLGVAALAAETMARVALAPGDEPAPIFRPR